MAFPYMIGPGGQPFIIQQIPLVPQAVIAQQPQPQPPPVPIPIPQPQKPPDYMSEERLQDKGMI